MESRPKSKRKKNNRLLIHLKKWKDLYEIVGVLCLVLTIIGLVIGTFISYRSLNISYRSLNILKDEFYIRNRPYIITKEHRFSGKLISLNGKECPYSIRVTLINESDIPATNVRGEGIVYLNGEYVNKAFLTSNGILTKGMPRYFDICLFEETYEASSNSKNKLDIIIIIRYSGMLGENPDAYSTYVQVCYDPVSNVFRISKMEIPPLKR